MAGVAAVDLARPMDAVRELRHCVRDLGFRALRVVPWLLPQDLAFLTETSTWSAPAWPGLPSRCGWTGT